MNATKTNTTKAPATNLSGWGVAWRIAGLAALIVAIIAAVLFGLPIGVAYIGGLGISATAITVLQGVLTAVAYLVIGFTAALGSDKIIAVFDRKSAAEAKVMPAATPAAEPAAA